MKIMKRKKKEEEEEENHLAMAGVGTHKLFFQSQALHPLDHGDLPRSMNSMLFMFQMPLLNASLYWIGSIKLISPSLFTTT